MAHSVSLCSPDILAPLQPSAGCDHPESDTSGSRGSSTAIGLKQHKHALPGGMASQQALSAV